MGIFGTILKVGATVALGLAESTLLGAIANRFPKAGRQGLIGYGLQKKDGSHDHRYNKGSDRTPAQQAGDKK